MTPPLKPFHSSKRSVSLSVVGMVAVCVLLSLATETPHMQVPSFTRWVLEGIVSLRAPLLVAAALLGAWVVVAFIRAEARTTLQATLRAEQERRVEEGTAALSAAYEDLRDSEARKTAIFEGSPDGIFTLDAASRILEINPAAERIFRVPRAQALRRDFLAMALAASAPPEQQQTVVRALQADVEPGRATRLELSGLRSDGDVFPAELTLIRVTAEGPPRFTVYVRDITERREVERMKSEFVSTVSHELRTPLTSIRGSLGLMEGGVLGELPTPVLDMVRIARTNTERLIRLINDILDLEKIESGKLELRLQPVEVEELVEATFSGLQGMADAAKVELHAEVHGTGQVRADRDRLIQVLTNLVSNSIKFSPAYSVVKLRAARTQEGQVQLSVVDQGPGIPSEKHARLFGKFQQLDSSDTRSKGGTGLGLAISQAIVEQHGGHIEVHSEIGRGSTFTFAIPAVRGDMGLAPVVRDDSRYNVLVATADTELSTLLRGLLTSEGYRVLRATTAEEAMRLIEAGGPDVLVLDPQQPEEESMNLVRRLRADPLTHQLPIVVLAEPTSTEELRLQRVAWVTRPFEEAHFLRALREVLRQPGQARVLLVDDDVDARRLLRSCLERMGAACYEAEDGERAVALAREIPPDLIVLDVMLPLLDGFEVVDLLRQDRVRSTPLIVFTVRELSREELRQHTLGNTRYILKKPSAEEELTQAAHELLGPLLQVPNAYPDARAPGSSSEGSSNQNVAPCPT
ncbi:ATP-binding protein [Hyalangium versicolor]|uniref:ATP-binding protein n=1 Tax=Hyalangium versicolor TaxID=2861190 RepID=UPI001CC9AF6A|nr:ATP-binding protein [Hyalangium versicolor]